MDRQQVLRQRSVQLPPLYNKVGLRIGWGPAKSELALPPGVDPDTLPLPRGDDGRILPHLVDGLEERCRICAMVPHVLVADFVFGVCVTFVHWCRFLYRSWLCVRDRKGYLKHHLSLPVLKL